MKYYLTILFLLIAPSGHALEFKCNFEEVYKDGSTQLGILLLKDSELRYEYFDTNLFTIFKKNSDFFYVKNNRTDMFEKIDQNVTLLNDITSILQKYPNVQNFYMEEDIHFSIEPSETTGFVKRIGVQSPKLNLSIYFRDCAATTIPSKYLNFFPYSKYP